MKSFWKQGWWGLGGALGVAVVLCMPGCFLNREGTLGSGSDGGADTGTTDADTRDAAIECAPGFVDLDGIPGCECEIRAEVCNGVDDDCDRTTDEEGGPCGTPGTCSEGILECAGGAPSACNPIATPVEECDNLIDDDCDMAVDEECICMPVGATRPCGESRGECSQGVQTCESAGWGSCEGDVGPGVEICNNLDDDCDGTIDGMVTSCSATVGVCTAGTRTCVAGVVQACTGIEPSTELCDAARRDEDCDGVPNNGCACDDGQTMRCGTCFGVRTCDITGTYGSCVDMPGTETCNGMDDNCDGEIDEGTTCGMCTRETNAGHSYLFCFSIMRTWDAARAYCMMFGYDLVVVETSAENTWLNGRERALAGNNVDWWYGGSDAAMEGEWRWIPTMTAVGFEAWTGAEPDAGGAAENCMSNENRSSSEWSSRACSQSYRFVCEAPVP